jgi:hypothetical protein
VSSAVVGLVMDASIAKVVGLVPAVHPNLNKLEKYSFFYSFFLDLA